MHERIHDVLPQVVFILPVQRDSAYATIVIGAFTVMHLVAQVVYGSFLCKLPLKRIVPKVNRLTDKLLPLGV